MTNIKCLCNMCSKNCSTCLKSELAVKGLLNYIYLNNGRKVTYACNVFSSVRARPKGAA